MEDVSGKMEDVFLTTTDVGPDLPLVGICDPRPYYKWIYKSTKHLTYGDYKSPRNLVRIINPD